jgi:ubiquinone/menaquinone biosynthesis C-methylase UbiE
MHTRRIYKQKRFQRETTFHDNWAISERIANIDVYQLFEGVTAMENQFIISHIGTLKGKKILDVGCGLGESAVYFALKGAEVTAVDISPKMIFFAKKLAKEYETTINFIVSPAEALKFDRESFDIVYCANLLHHLPIDDRTKFIKEMREVLKREGWFYSWDPLVYNPAIKIYRKMANELHSKDEIPLDFRILKDFKRIFSQTNHKEFWLLTLILFLKYYFINRYDPNKIRYWKEIYKEKPENINWWFGRLRKIDNILLRMPCAKRLAWNTVIYAQK